MKKLMVMLLFSLLLVSFASYNVVAQSTDTSKLCDSLGWNTDNWLCQKLAIWEPGVPQDASSEYKSALAIGIKYFMLLLIILLIYSGLSYAKFPANEKGESKTILQIIIAVITGFLVTFFISSNELLTAMNSYTALGIALIIFFPILILGFFTMIVASKASPFGIFLQKILWIIYSVYLFIKAGFLALGKYLSANQGSFDNKTLNSFIQFFIGDVTDPKYATADNTILFILLVVSIAVFIIMVWKDSAVTEWIARERREAELEAQRSTIERSRNYDRTRAEAMERQ